MELIKSQRKLSEALKSKAINLGFNPVGIAKIPGSKTIKLRTKALQNWLHEGYQAEMHWMEAPRRQDPKQLLEGAKSLIAVGLNYYVDVKKHPKSLSIARYGWGNDYHKVISKRLKILGQWLEKQRPNCKWKICVDSSPVLEKAWAEEAGLGWIGKNSNLINQQTGSWMVLGNLLCTEELIADLPSEPNCGHCTECLKACPTKAITEPFVIDSRLCLAYHTIENREESLPLKIRQSLGTWIAGCDICQEVCPWNKKRIPSSKDPDVQPKNWVLELTQNQALRWDDKTWQEKLRGSALKRIKPWMWRRNALLIKKHSHINSK